MALVHIGVVSLGAEPVSRREVVRAAIEGLFAVMVGAIVAAYLGPQANRFFTEATPRISALSGSASAWGRGASPLACSARSSFSPTPPHCETSPKKWSCGG